MASTRSGSWELATASRNQDYRVARRPVDLLGDSGNWVAAVQSASARSASQNVAATQTAGALARTGLEGTTALGAGQLAATADITQAGLAATSNAYASAVQADAAIKRETAARGPEWMQGIKLAGGLGLLAYGLKEV